MRTNIVLDDALVAKAMQCTGIRTKKAVIEEALRTLVQLNEQRQVRQFFGKLSWEGNLDEMRQGRILHEATAEYIIATQTD